MSIALTEQSAHKISLLVKRNNLIVFGQHREQEALQDKNTALCHQLCEEEGRVMFWQSMHECNEQRVHQLGHEIKVLKQQVSAYKRENYRLTIRLNT